MPNPRITDEQQALLDFVDNEFTSIEQALRMAADDNERAAKEIEALPDEEQDKPGFPGPLRQVAVLMRESADGWRRKADRLQDLYDKLPQEG